MHLGYKVLQIPELQFLIHATLLNLLFDVSMENELRVKAWGVEKEELESEQGLADSMGEHVTLRPSSASQVAQTVKNPPAMQETQIQSLGWEDTLEKGMATHSSILAWRVPWTEESGGLQSTG